MLQRDGYRFCLAMIAVGLTGASGAHASLIGKGKSMPAWSARTVENRRISSAELKGKAILLNFFSFTCAPCHEEYPHLQALQAKYAGKGFTVISVSSDESLTDAGAFGREVHATFPVIHDPKSLLTDRFGVLGTPANVVVDRHGKVIASLEGLDPKALDAAVARAVAGK